MKRILIGLGLLGSVLASAAMQIKGPPPASVNLVTERESIQPGEAFEVGLLFKIKPHWHVYWKNAGDSGTPPNVKWELPMGFSAGDIRWPAPRRIDIPPLTNYGYENEVLLPSLVKAPATLTSGTKTTLRAKVSWLVCQQVCLPGHADVSLTLPVVNTVGKNSNSKFLFARWLKQIPRPSQTWRFTATLKDSQLALAIEGKKSVTQALTFFPWNDTQIANSAQQTTASTPNGAVLNLVVDSQSTQPISQLQGVLVALDSDPVFIDIPVIDGQSIPTNKEIIMAPAVPASLWEMLAFAFLGGLILNLMPCVFPVLSIKILGFVEQAGHDRAKLRRHGWVFVSGVLVSFWALVGALIILRAGGQHLGWGFQLQSPFFLLGLCTLLFMMALNFLGVFEIGENLMGVGSGLASQSGYAGSFFSGVLATVVATPCTAPFMGSAVGFAFTQPPISSFAIFTSLALGMALPYLALTHAPGLLKFLPPPGRWMETLKQAMAFPLFATVIWLIWVFGQQTGMDGVLRLLYALLLFAFGVWVVIRSKIKPASIGRRAVGVIVFLVGLTFGINGARMANPPAGNKMVTETNGMTWEPFSPQRIAELNAQGKPIFVDFTAAWCVSCQVNEKVVFSSAEVRKKFHDLGVVPMKADWTNGDETISDTLKKFQHEGVPFYLLYGRTAQTAPRALPEVLTPGIVLEALNHL